MRICAHRSPCISYIYIYIYVYIFMWSSQAHVRIVTSEYVQSWKWWVIMMHDDDDSQRWTIVMHQDDSSWWIIMMHPDDIQWRIIMMHLSDSSWWIIMLHHDDSSSWIIMMHHDDSSRWITCVFDRHAYLLMKHYRPKFDDVSLCYFNVQKHCKVSDKNLYMSMGLLSDPYDWKRCKADRPT